MCSTSLAPVRVRYAPSPTGYLHIGAVRTALFNYLLARQTGGVFIVRFEDTDTERNVPGADEKMMSDLLWLGLRWNEGAGVGGPHGPYYQSQRLDIYRRHVDHLLAQGQAYYAFETSDELEKMREAAQAEKKAFHYPRPAVFPGKDDADRARAEGRPVVVRFKMADKNITVFDQVMGEVTIAAEELDDFIIMKADGMPTYHLANVVDDALMGVTHVLRGQEFLAQTPRHIALQEAFGFATPVYAHLPLILDMKGRKLSKRDGDVEVFSFRKAGYLPEVMLNFVALLGWSPGADRERMTLDEMVTLFSIDRIGKTNAKFDRDKLLAFNTDAIAAATPERLLATFKDYISLNDTPFSGLSDDVLRELLRVNTGFRTFHDIENKSGFIYRPDDAIQYDPAAVKKVLHKDDNAGLKMLQILLPRLDSLEPWTHSSIETLLNAICAEHQTNMGKVAQPIRVAVSGTTVSPQIGDTLVLLGKTKTIARIRRTLTDASC